MELVACNQCTEERWTQCREILGRAAVLEKWHLESMDSTNLPIDDIFTHNKIGLKVGHERTEELLAETGCELSLDEIANNLLVIREELEKRLNGR